MAKISNGKDNCNGNEKKDSFAIEEFGADRHGLLTKILTDFEDHLTEKAGHCLGYHVNLDLNHLMDLSPLLRFHINNVGDPFKDSSFSMHSKKFEVSVLDWFAQLWEIEKDECWGYVTNGGTEGNLQGLLLGMDCVIIRTLTTGEIDCNDLREKLCLNKDKPAIINLNIGTTFKGGVDNLDLVIKTLEECGFSNDRFYIHCDAALSGLISPFLEQGPMFSFKKPIGSVSVSGHKLLGSSMPCGVLMTKKKYITTISKNVEYLNTLDNTISGSRNGLASIFMWYSLNVKGRLGLQQDVKKCLMNAQYLRDRLKDAGISSMLNEMSFVVVFERPPNPEFIKYWNLSCEGNMTHVIAMPHVTVKILEDFVNDFVRERNIWYRCGRIQPPCLAEEIGTYNCCCSIHGKGSLQNGN
ncbi:hypothetical protein DH2020_010411 [Rehmannia glutinosa]|uniref:Histidine decarboxylase n=1 Tax=Rehmannia glutinosa TaxID=99300 RepID=A0ABR0XAJ1_REHGL